MRSVLETNVPPSEKITLAEHINAYVRMSQDTLTCAASVVQLVVN